MTRKDCPGYWMLQRRVTELVRDLPADRGGVRRLPRRLDRGAGGVPGRPLRAGGSGPAAVEHAGAGLLPMGRVALPRGGCLVFPCSVRGGRQDAAVARW